MRSSPRHRPRAAPSVANVVADGRGVALPMALLTLLAMTALAVAFLTVAQSEPSIAANHLRAAQARAMAESGIERAVWALNHATAPGGIGGTGVAPNVSITGTPTPPYDGSAFIAVAGLGGFRVAITGTDRAARTARAVGWSGRESRTGGSVVAATLVRVRNLASEVPCALCVASSLTLATSTIDARASEGSDCGGKVAAWSTDAITVGGATMLAGAGAPEPTAIPVDGRDTLASQTRRDFLLASGEIDVLKALAASRGAYVKASPNAPVDLTRIADGVVFVDTPDGTNVLGAANLATVTLRRGFSARSPFTGWIVVNGDVAIESDFGGVDGLVYAANAVTVLGTGDAAVRGLLIAAHALGGASTVRDARIVFECAAARAAGHVPDGWFAKAGSYCDGTTGC